MALNENEIVVSRPNDERLSRSLHGLTRTLIQNLIIGVTSGYEKKLEIVGTGYRVTRRVTTWSSLWATPTRSTSPLPRVLPSQWRVLTS